MTVHWPGECELPCGNATALAPSDPKCAAFHALADKIALFTAAPRPINKLFHVSRGALKVENPNHIPGPLLAALICSGDAKACIIDP